MNRKVTVRCRLAELLAERALSPEELAEDSGLTLEQIDAYMTPEPQAILLPEIGAILGALADVELPDLFETRVELPEAEESAPPMFEDEWTSPCPCAGGGRHIWYKDAEVSDSVYQEFVCRACGRRISVIL